MYLGVRASFPVWNSMAGYLGQYGVADGTNKDLAYSIPISEILGCQPSSCKETTPNLVC